MITKLEKNKVRKKDTQEYVLKFKDSRSSTFKRIPFKHKHLRYKLLMTLKVLH